MNIVLIGNAKVRGDKIREIATALAQSDINVRYPSQDGLDTGEDADIIETFERIDWSDAVVAIPRKELSFDSITTSELAYAKHAKKPVFIYYE